MQLIRGQKVKLGDVLANANQFNCQIRLTTPVAIDVSIFGLDKDNRLSDEDYMIFYNQPTSPCGAIKLTNNTPSNVDFSIDLATLNPKIERLMVTLAIDGDGVMSQIGASQLNITNAQGQIVASFAVDGSMFAQERAVMLFEIYQKDSVWRLNAVAQGFNGGLAKLIEFYGGEVANENTTPSNVQQVTIPPIQTIQSQKTTHIDLKKKISLEKAQKTGNQSIIDLTKKSLVQLEKKNLLGVQARVALVLDASGSMNWQYKNGDVQKVVDRLMPLAINFDDDGSFECWAFAQHTQQLDDVTLTNVSDFINTTNNGWKNWQVGSRYNEEIPAIEAVIKFYTGIALNSGVSSKADNGLLSRIFGSQLTSTPQPITPNVNYHNQSQLPTYVLFISDGGVGSSRKMQNILTQAANFPIFWQFVGIGGNNYGVLEKLDDMTGRVVDNCNFFDLDSINSVSDERLYELLLEEFPTWLTESKRLGMLS